jgi:hypothetical protein
LERERRCDRSVGCHDAGRAVGLVVLDENFRKPLITKMRCGNGEAQATTFDVESLASASIRQPLALVHYFGS